MAPNLAGGAVGAKFPSLYPPPHPRVGLSRPRGGCRSQVIPDVDLGPFLNQKRDDVHVAEARSLVVTTVLGVKAAAKFGALAILAVFLKKAGVLILVPLAMLFGFIKKVFRRTPMPPD
jgi:hypothetical protein